jgi:ATP phosphoribosyltransferase regulatory subunit
VLKAGRILIQMAFASMPSSIPAPDVDSRAAALLAHYIAAGCRRADPAILQPADVFLDVSGEDIRRRMYLTTDAGGRELCLRPDLTIPVCRDYLASPEAGEPATFTYLGPVFRYRGEAPGEFLQGGVESFGRADTAATDAEMLALALEAAQHYGLSTPLVRLGDVGLFQALADRLPISDSWKRRLVKDFRRGRMSAERVPDAQATAARTEYEGVLAALDGANPKAARALVTDLLSIAGISAVGGRSVSEIADRFLEQAALGRADTLPAEVADLVTRFLAISGTPDEAAADLRHLAASASVDLGAALDLFESRTGFLAARGLDVGAIRFSTAFGRGLDYYTGMVFELHDPVTQAGGQLVGGGRYDALLTRLGAAAPIPAVGFAVWIDRLAALESGSRA